MTTTDRCDQLICVWLHIQVVDAMENATKRNKCVAVCGRPFYWHNINIFCIRNSDIMRKRLAIKKSRDFSGNEKENWCLICFDKMRYHFFPFKKLRSDDFVIVKFLEIDSTFQSALKNSSLFPYFTKCDTWSLLMLKAYDLFWLACFREKWSESINWHKTNKNYVLYCLPVIDIRIFQRIMKM